MKCNILVGVATCLLIAAARGQDRCVKGDRAPLSPRLPHAPRSHPPPPVRNPLCVTRTPASGTPTVRWIPHQLTHSRPHSPPPPAPTNASHQLRLRLRRSRLGDQVQLRRQVLLVLPDRVQGRPGRCPGRRGYPVRVHGPGRRRQSLVRDRPARGLDARRVLRQEHHRRGAERVGHRCF